MNRLLRFLPIAIPVVVRFLRSPRGQALIRKVRGQVGGAGNTGGAPRR